MGDERTWDGLGVHSVSHGRMQPGTARCELCGRDVSALADADGRRDELGPSVLYWCPECAAPQVREAWPDVGYLPVQHLGGGLHGTWQMWHAATGRVLAVRQIVFWTRREENVQRYIQETQPLLSLAHPHLTRLVDVRASRRGLLVASAFVPGGNLWDWATEENRVPSVRLAVQVVCGVLDGLRQLHARGIAHANIHPWNILLPEGIPQRARLCLAGRAFSYMHDTFDPESDPPPFSVRSVVAPVFGGPGRLIGLYDVSPAGDLYAMGQVLYLLLTGELALELPWRSGERPDLAQWLAILRHGEPVPARARRPELPAALAEVVDRAVAKDPAARFIGVEDFASALEALGDPQADADVTQAAPSAAAVAPEGPYPAGAAVEGSREDAVPLEWRVGETILDLYEVRDVFTSGGMGLVYRVHHRTWDLDVAVKCPRPEYFRTEAQRAEFVREAETWVDLGLHPHIVTCHYVRTLGGIPRIFAEFVEGGSLKDWIRDRRLYAGAQEQALERILDVAIQFAWGLAYAHEQGLVHQDVRPANVLMTPAGTAKVTDFGLARAQLVAAEYTGAPGGGLAAAYCSPEQAAGERLAQGADIWSWGVSLLEMVSGEVTWLSGQAAPAILDMLLNEGPAVAGPPPMPAAVAGLLRQCFQQEPSARAGMAEVAARLVDIYRSVVRQEYPRRLPRPAELQAGSLNNRALSLLDLGRQDEAQAAWQQALAEEPYQTEATYNAGLYRWQAGQITDPDLVRQLEAVARSQPGAWLPRYLLGQVHLQRRDLEAARAALDEAARLAPGAPQVQAALRRLDDMPSMPSLRDLEGRTEQVQPLAISPDGRRAGSASEEGRLREWQVGADRVGLPWAVSRAAELGEVRAAIAGRELEAARLALSGGRAAEAAQAVERALQTPGCEQDRAALDLWHAAGSRVGRRKGLRLTPRRLRTLEGHTGDVLVVACTPDGRRAISGSADDSLRVWDLPSGECLHTLQEHTGMVQAVAVTPDGRWALSGSSDKTLRVWDLASGACLRALEGHSASVESVAAIPGGHLAVSIGYRDTLRVWDLASGECLHTVKMHADPSLRSGGLSVTPDGRWAISGGDLSALRVWDLARGRYSHALKVQAGPGQIFGLDVVAIAGGRLAISLAMNNALRVWDLASGARLSTLQGHRGFVAGVALTLDGHWAVSGSHDLTLRVWHLASGTCLATLESDEPLLRSVALTPDGHYLLAGGTGAIGQWVLDWDYEFPEPAEWDEGARPHLESFLALHSPAPRGLFQRSRPEWTTEHFEQLLTELGLHGYGWLRPEGVRLKLEAMARER